MAIAKTRKLGVRSKIFLFSKTVQDYENKSADICLVTSTWALSLYVNTSISIFFCCVLNFLGEFVFNYIVSCIRYSLSHEFVWQM